MAFRELIKNKSLRAGFLTGLALTFGSTYLSPLANLVEFIFDKINVIDSKWGIWSSLANSYLLSSFSYLVIYYVTTHRLSLRDFMKFSLGLLLSFILFLILAVIAISQFQFGF